MTGSGDMKYVNGDTVYFKQKDNRWRGPGTVIGQDGQFVLVRNQHRWIRVHPCRLQLIPKTETYQSGVNEGRVANKVKDPEVVMKPIDDHHASSIESDDNEIEIKEINSTEESEKEDEEEMEKEEENVAMVEEVKPKEMKEDIKEHEVVYNQDVKRNESVILNSYHEIEDTDREDDETEISKILIKLLSQMSRAKDKELKMLKVRLKKFLIRSQNI